MPDLPDQYIKNKDGERLVQGLPRSFSGSDFSIWAYYEAIEAADSDFVKLGTLQTISTSTVASISPVEALGTASPLDFTTGAKTSAGSLVFTLLDKEPLLDLYNNIPNSLHRNVRDNFLSPEQVPLFNIVIEGDNEYLPREGEVKTKIFKVVVGVKLFMNGETLSIDDFYTEQTFQYQAKHITEWVSGDVSFASLKSYTELQGKGRLSLKYSDTPKGRETYQDASRLDQLNKLLI